MAAIILIGYRGVGKSAVASEIIKQLSENKFSAMKISLDDELAVKLGNLQTFIKKNGWEAFRAEETDLLKKIKLPLQQCVIDCGGGIVESEENIELLKKLGKIFYIRAEVKTIQQRMQTTHARLSLSGNQSFFDEIKKVLEYRDPLYSKAADVIIESDLMSIEECAEKILSNISWDFVR